MTSFMFYNYVDELGLEHKFIPVKCPNKNAFIESFFSIVEIQLLQVCFFKSMSDVFEKLVNFINFYNNERLQGSTDYNSAIEFKKKSISKENIKVIRCQHKLREICPELGG